jgi:serine/alanine adding enzyme
MLKIIKNKKVDINKWNNILLHNPYASPFQTNKYFDFYNSVDDRSADVFAVEENGKYTALVVVTIQKEKGVKSYFSRRGIVYGGPLVEENKEESLIFLLDYLIKHYKSKLIYIEIRNYFNYMYYSDLIVNREWQYLPYMNITIHLKDRGIKEVLSGMKYNRRRQISMSLENNASYKQCESEEELNELYKILEDLYKTRVRLPLPEFLFFESLWKSDIGKVFVVNHQKIIIGGSFCLIRKNHSIYTMYYCGLRDYNKKIYPTHLAVLAAIEYGIKNGMNYLDFMGAGLIGDEYGVRKYKQEFGGDLNEYGRYRKILSPILFNISVKGLNIIKRINP